jgi:hypothetical protein
VTQYTKTGENIPNHNKIYQMAEIYSKVGIKYTNVFHSKTLQNVPKFEFLVLKYITRQTCRPDNAKRVFQKILFRSFNDCKRTCGGGWVYFLNKFFNYVPFDRRLWRLRRDSDRSGERAREPILLFLSFFKRIPRRELTPRHEFAPTQWRRQLSLDIYTMRICESV